MDDLWLCAMAVPWIGVAVLAAIPRRWDPHANDVAIAFGAATTALATAALWPSARALASSTVTSEARAERRSADGAHGRRRYLDLQHRGRLVLMKRVSPYLKMRVLEAIEFAPGNSVIARIRHVAGTTFLDEHGIRRQFTWRTIQTWYSRYKKDGITSMKPKPRADKGRTRKVELEPLQEAIEQVLPSFRDEKTPTIAAVYRCCIERNLLRREQVAPNTFRRIVNALELLKPETESNDKRRLAFAKAHANEMWQF